MAIDAIQGSGIGFSTNSQAKASAAVSKNQDPQKTSQKAYSSVEEKGLNKEPVKAQRPTTDRVELQPNSGVSDSAKTETVKKPVYTLTDNPAKTAVRNATIARSASAKTTASKVESATTAETGKTTGTQSNKKPQLPADTMAELIKAATEASEKISEFSAQNNKASDSKIQDLNNYIKNNSSQNIAQLVSNNATQNQMAAIMMMK